VIGYLEMACAWLADRPDTFTLTRSAAAAQASQREHRSAADTPIRAMPGVLARFTMKMNQARRVT
jgi:hypothetical protein